MLCIWRSEKWLRVWSAACDSAVSRSEEKFLLARVMSTCRFFVYFCHLPCVKDWEFDPGRQPDVSPYVIVLNKAGMSTQTYLLKRWHVPIIFAPHWQTLHFFLLLCSISHAHHSGFQPRRTKQWQHGVGGHEGVRHYAVGVHEHHLSAPRAPAWPLSGPCAGWKQWLPPDKVHSYCERGWLENAFITQRTVLNERWFYQKPVMTFATCQHIKKASQRAFVSRCIKVRCNNDSGDFICLNFCLII